MNRRPVWAVWMVVGLGCSHAPPASAPSREEMRQEWLTALRSDVRQIAANDGFQGALRVLHGGKAEIDDGFGDLSCLPLGSGRMLLSVVAVGALVDAGKLGFDDRVVRLLPQYARTSFDGLTVAHLLTSSAGLAPTTGATVRDSLAAAARVPLAAPAGTRVDTTDPRPWLLLEEVLAAADGRSWAALVQERVLGPSGMTETSLAPTAACPTAEGGASSVTDILRLAEALRTGRVVRPATRDALLAPRVDLAPGIQRALGFTIRSNESEMAVGFSAAGSVPALEMWMHVGSGDMLALLGRTDVRSAQHLRTAVGEFFALPPALPGSPSRPRRPH